MDLYSLLGLTRTASSGEIERAYRRLARRYHPGVNPGDRVAEQAYQQIQEAYRVLADADRRREYDHGAVSTPRTASAAGATVAFEGFDFSAPAEGALAATFSELFADVFQHAARQATSPDVNGDIHAVVRVPFLDAMRGAEVPISVTRQAWCTSCGGQGHLARAAVVCPACNGEGQRRWARGHMVFSGTCETCLGQGRLVTQPCRVCRGSGVAPRTEVVTVHVPAGTEPGARLAMPGRGHASGSGAAPGDLYVTVEVGTHPYFRREGRDLHVSVPVGVHEAALGAVVEVPTLGEPVQVRIPAGTAPGQQLRVRGFGAAAGGQTDQPGDLVVDVQVYLPPVLDQRSAALLGEFGQLNDMSPVRRARFDQD
jgi:molecular chaperone DnaJ